MPKNSQVLPAKKFARLVEVARALKPLKQEGPSFHVSFALGNTGKPVAIATNSYTKRNCEALKYRATKHTNQSAYIAGVHAECGCLGKLKYLSPNSRFTLINIRINNNGELANSMPCPNCALMIGRTPSIKRIFYSTDEGNFRRFP